MPLTPKITTKAEHKRALDRVSAMMNNCANDAEVEELRALAKAVQAYEQEHFEFWKLTSDGADHLEYMLDEEQTTLDELVPVFGGMEPFLEFMTRRRELDPATLEALVSELGIRREDLDKPFCKPEGWEDITLENSTCCDEDPCPMEVPEWRERLKAYRKRELTGMHRIGQDAKGVTSAPNQHPAPYPTYPAYLC